MHYVQLWQQIVAKLDSELQDWRERIESLNQIPAVRQREEGKVWTDDDIFRALVLAVLSSCIDWEKIELAMQDLPDVYHDFRLEIFAKLTDHDIKTRVVPALKGLGLGLPQLEKDQLNLLKSAKRLVAKRIEHGSLDAYIRTLSTSDCNDPIKLAARFGDSEPDKLPGLGLPLAAEFLKNIGYNVAKVDRHIRRALDAWGLATFGSYPKNAGTSTDYRARNTTAPQTIKAMERVQQFADEVGEPCCFVDNAIWLLCCQSGCHLTNEQLRKLAVGL